MEMKTVQIINNISKLDTNIQVMVFLKFEETLTWLYDNIDNYNELERCLRKVWHTDLKDTTMSNEIIKMCGFLADDEIADGYIQEYCSSEKANRMEILKKQLIEWAIELEEIELEEKRLEEVK